MGTAMPREVPEWIAEEQRRRVAEAQAAYASVHDECEGLGMDEEEYVGLYLAEMFPPLAWT